MSIKYTLKNYLKDNLCSIIIYLFSSFTLLTFCIAAKINSQIIILIAILSFSTAILIIIYNYLRKRSFYQQVSNIASRLRQKYLLSETLPVANFLEAKIFQEILYQTDKSMVEEITRAKTASSNFREYIELWIHEVKDPLTTLILLCENNPNTDSENLLLLQQLQALIEQVLYFVRAENSERDYLIESTEIENVVKQVLLNYRPELLANKINITTKLKPTCVLTDSKWLEFILGQIISNCIKYGAKNITIELQEEAQKVSLRICDDGIGIQEKDLPRIFEKSFTGTNGHRKNARTSTGIGLYLVKNLCDKLGHEVSAESKPKSGTTMQITFSKHQYYETVRKK